MVLGFRGSRSVHPRDYVGYCHSVSEASCPASFNRNCPGIACDRAFLYRYAKQMKLELTNLLSLTLKLPDFLFTHNESINRCTLFFSSSNFRKSISLLGSFSVNILLNLGTLQDCDYFERFYVNVGRCTGAVIGAYINVDDSDIVYSLRFVYRYMAIAAAAVAALYFVLYHGLLKPRCHAHTIQGPRQPPTVVQGTYIYKYTYCRNFLLI